MKRTKTLGGRILLPLCQGNTQKKLISNIEVTKMCQRQNKKRISFFECRCNLSVDCILVLISFNISFSLCYCLELALQRVFFSSIHFQSPLLLKFRVMGVC